MASSSNLDERAVVGFAKSAAYDQYRPAYSNTIVQLLLEKLGVAGKKGAKILDLAAGTGKFTEALAARDEQYEIVAVEPHDGMREVLEGKKLNGAIVKAGKADKIPLEDASLDAVICAQVGLETLFSCYSYLQHVRLIISNPRARAKKLVVLPLVRQQGVLRRDPSGSSASRPFRHGLEHRRV